MHDFLKRKGFKVVMLSGEITKAVTVASTIRVSKGAKAAIEAAGGKIEE